jgi:hypothetical protein
MIEVTVRVDEEELAYIRIENVETRTDQTADYAVYFAVNRALGAVGIHRRGVAGFPRTKYNALALLRQALATLEPHELELEHGTTPKDLTPRRWWQLRQLPRS